MGNLSGFQHIFGILAPMLARTLAVWCLDGLHADHFEEKQIDAQRTISSRFHM